MMYIEDVLYNGLYSFRNLGDVVCTGICGNRSEICFGDSNKKGMVGIANMGVIDVKGIITLNLLNQIPLHLYKFFIICTNQTTCDFISLNSTLDGRKGNRSISIAIAGAWDKI